MPSNYLDIREDDGFRNSANDGAMELEIGAFYGVQNKIQQRREDMIMQLLGKNDRENSSYHSVQIPESPAGADIDVNIKKAQDSFNPFWFIEMVRPGGPWDYKVKNLKYEDFGNFNFGATALAFGFQEKWALQAAGLVQVYTSKSKKDFKKSEYIKGVMNFGDSFHGAPYGDEAKDQVQIKAGFRYYKEVYLKNNKQRILTADDMYKIGFEVLADRYPGSELIARSILRMMEN